MKNVTLGKGSTIIITPSKNWGFFWRIGLSNQVNCTGHTTNSFRKLIRSDDLTQPDEWITSVTTSNTLVYFLLQEAFGCIMRSGDGKNLETLKFQVAIKK